MSAAEGNWTNLPLHQVLFEWLIKNASFPTDMSIIVAYFALFLIVWFTMVWATRFIISIIWPLILIASGIALFHIVKFYEPEDIANMVTNVLTKVLDTIIMPVAVRLVEVLALLTLLGILTGVSIFVVLAQRATVVLLMFLTPLAYIVYGVLYVAEKIFVSILGGLLYVTHNVTENLN